MEHQVLERFIESEIEPNIAQWERERNVPLDFFTKAGDAGLCGLMAPKADGGSGLPLVELTRVFERLAYSDLGLAFALVPHNNLCSAICNKTKCGFFLTSGFENNFF